MKNNKNKKQNKKTKFRMSVGFPLKKILPLRIEVRVCKTVLSRPYVEPVILQFFEGSTKITRRFKPWVT